MMIEEKVKIKCSKCTSIFRERATRLRNGHQLNCPQCNRLITFDSGSFTVTPDQAKRLSTIAEAINRTIKDNPQEVFLIEGYTDAVGADIDNLSLSDRRAQSVAAVLTQDFQVPPENLTTQGYGEQNLKVNTQEANRENRRVTVRRITPLLQQQAEGQQPPAPR